MYSQNKQADIKRLVVEEPRQKYTHSHMHIQLSRFVLAWLHFGYIDVYLSCIVCFCTDQKYNIKRMRHARPALDTLVRNQQEIQVSWPCNSAWLDLCLFAGQ